MTRTPLSLPILGIVCLCCFADLLGVVHVLKCFHDGLAVACGGEGVHAGDGESTRAGSEKPALGQDGPFVMPLL